jgi:hypothetical protein
MSKNTFELLENGKVIKTATIFIDDFSPLVKIDLLQTNTSNKDKTWMYENFEIIEKKASTEDLVSDVSNCITCCAFRLN